MNSQEIRQAFFDYFQEQGHTVQPSSPVVPQGDATLLFTNAGMNQFKNIFTGREKSPFSRAVTVQKCIRAGGKHNDLDNVGYTARHLTFFEMLGNFSFGDYFKEDAIRFGWEFLTDRMKLNPDELWITVYREDDEARKIWREQIGVPADRVIDMGEKDNYWSMGDVGPCGPCSEIHLDRGEKHGCGPKCGIGQCDCDRYFEIWNLVFMQFDQTEGGRKVPLAKPSIDTGMGLERIAMVKQGVESVFETDVLRSVTEKVEELTGKPRGAGESGTPHRVIADHVRSLVFAFADGAEPSNEGRGYVLRRILRRAARYGRKLVSTDEPLLARLVPTVIDKMEGTYPEIRQRQQYIEGVIAAEEERFGRTLDQGIDKFAEIAARVEKKGGCSIAGKDVFLLYDTFGFPVDLVEQMSVERGLSVDTEGYEREMAEQKERSRGASSFSIHSGESSDDALEIESYPETEFVGYTEDSCSSELMAARSSGDGWKLVLSPTPFYAESGGQVGDTGVLRGSRFAFEVDNTQKDRGRWVHFGRLIEGDPGAIQAGEKVDAEIHHDRRRAIERNHTATHLLHAALREVLGDHVHQKGSLVDPTRLRFDVTHFSGVTPEERERVEDLVQQAIARNDAVETFETDYPDALSRGAMALFGEKYGDRVRVVKIGDFSIELCGGTHTPRTGNIASFQLVQEGSVSAGVRRVEALTAGEALRLQQKNSRLIEQLSAQLRVRPAELLERVDKLQDEVKKLRSGKAKKDADSGGASGVEPVVEKLELGGEAAELHHGVFDGVGMDALLSIYDRSKKKVTGVFVLMARQGKKLQVLVAVTGPLVKKGLDAREIFKSGEKLIGGRGGGKPDLLRGGGSEASGAEKALEAMLGAVREKAAS